MTLLSVNAKTGKQCIVVQKGMNPPLVMTSPRIFEEAVC